MIFVYLFLLCLLWLWLLFCFAICFVLFLTFFIYIFQFIYILRSKSHILQTYTCSIRNGGKWWCNCNILVLYLVFTYPVLLLFIFCLFLLLLLSCFAFCCVLFLTICFTFTLYFRILCSESRILQTCTCATYMKFIGISETAVNGKCNCIMWVTYLVFDLPCSSFDDLLQLLLK